VHYRLFCSHQSHRHEPPSLTNWTEQHLTTLFQATALADFNNAFDAFIAHNASITVNGQKTSRDDYKQMLGNKTAGEASASVNFLGTVEIPTNGSEPLTAGTVGTFINAIIEGKFVFDDVAVSHTVNASVNFVISQDPSIQPSNSTDEGSFDSRRVTELNQANIFVMNPLSPPQGVPATVVSDTPPAATSP